MGAARSDVTVARVRELVAAVLDMGIEHVTEDALLYEDLEIDSLHKTQIRAWVEREFQVRIGPEDWGTLRTVADVVTVVRDKALTTN